jgi:hypothetical protein
MAKVHAGGIQNSLQVQHYLASFGSDIFIVELAGHRIQTDLTGDEQFIAF